MSDFARLENVLVKLRLRQRAPGEGRKLRGSGVEALMASLIAEIDETILPRRLVFTADDAAQLHLAVANRRLQALLSPVPDISGAQDLTDHMLVDGKDPSLELLGQVVREVLATAQTVSINAFAQTAGGFDAERGAPSSGLIKAWDVQVAPARVSDPSEVLGNFLDEIGDNDADAWLRIEGEDVTDQAGSAERLTSLGEQAAVFLDSYFGKFDKLFADDPSTRATVVSPGEKGEVAALFVEFGDVSAFVAAKPGRVAALATYWQSMVAE